MCQSKGDGNTIHSVLKWREKRTRAQLWRPHPQGVWSTQFSFSWRRCLFVDMWIQWNNQWGCRRANVGKHGRGKKKEKKSEDKMVATVKKEENVGDSTQVDFRLFILVID